MTELGSSAALSPRAIEALLAFWAEAGVDACLGEAPVDRLAAPPTRPPPPVTAPAREALAPVPGRPEPRKARVACDQAVTSARDLAAAAGDFPALIQAIEGFEGGALRSPGARTVVLRGDPATADVLVIGDCPSAGDEAEGAPFSGPGGRLLDRMLQAAGLGERALLINTVFWRPRGGASPERADQDACRPFVERAAALLKPKAVLLIGEAAAQSVLRSQTPILKLRGRWNVWAGESAPLALPALATFPLSLLLAQPLARKQTWSDLLTLAERVATPGDPP